MREAWTLTWPEVDPDRHPFDAAAAPAVVRALAPAAAFPGRDATARRAWADAMGSAIVGHYGRWASGWRWAVGEGDLDGGPVRAWCCFNHSITTPEATPAAVAAGLVEWRGWLEECATASPGSCRSRRMSPAPGNARSPTW
ncbi:hypothetical protein [Dactylosporangium sp. CA-139066]|uniref:hypothetical protein n=1 Tax=Dactylosporangium sp. CA-139066 TaxID=3239930 RepID=UPI003D941F35